MKRYFLLLGILVLASGCGDDDDNGIDIVPPRALSEVAPENDAEIQEFLQTHFYNYEDFENPPAGFDFRIRIDSITGENSDKTPLVEQVRDTIINVSSSEFFLSEEEEDVPHKVYYLVARQGVGAKPSLADSIFVRYTGRLLDNTVFRNSNEFSPTWFDLTDLQQPQTNPALKDFRGMAVGASKIRAGGTIIDNEDGSFSVEDTGIGFVIFPSGLGNFNNVASGIPQYSPLIFTIDMFTINPTDHDGDGVPSIDEDINQNGFLFDDNTDSESERERGLRFGIANFQDPDDDGDGVLTRDEISDENGNIIFPYPDTDNDGTPDYLDPNILRERGN